MRLPAQQRYPGYRARRRRQRIAVAIVGIGIAIFVISVGQLARELQGLSPADYQEEILP